MKISEQAKELYQLGYRAREAGMWFNLSDPSSVNRVYSQVFGPVILDPGPYDSAQPDILLETSDSDDEFITPSCQITTGLLTQLEAFSNTVEGFLCDVERIGDVGKIVVESFRKFTKEIPDLEGPFLKEPCSICLMITVIANGTLCEERGAISLQENSGFRSGFYALPTVKKALSKSLS